MPDDQDVQAAVGALIPFLSGVPLTARIAGLEYDRQESVQPGTSRASSHHDTQADAQAVGHRYLHNESGGELITQGRVGRIRDKTTVPRGHDPYPPKR